MQEFGFALDRDWLVFDIDPCVCHLSRYCLLFILTASPAEKIRLSKIKNTVCEYKDGVVYYVCQISLKYMHKSDFFPFCKTFRIDTMGVSFALEMSE